MPTSSRIKSWPYALWFAICLSVALAVGTCWALTSPKAILLVPARGADWIRVDQPFDLAARPPDSFAIFSSQFDVLNGPSTATLQVMALRRFVIFVDGKKIFDNGVTVGSWRQEHHIDLPAWALTDGTHKLRVMVGNKYGPAMVRIDCEQLDIHTDTHWMASQDQHAWSPAVDANQPWEPTVANDFPTAPSSIVHLFPLLLLLMGLGGAGHLVITNYYPGPQVPIAMWIKRAVLAGWIVLSLHNITKFPANMGYDLPAHLEYVHYVAQHWRIPLPTDGIEMYHPPVFYLLSALLFKSLTSCGVASNNADLALRVIPLLCGMIMVEICYRAARIASPASQFQQGVATVVGGLLPMNLYMAHAVSNEPLAGVLGALVMLICLQLLTNPIVEFRSLMQRSFLFGLLIGIAVLVKVSGLVWLGIACGVMLFVMVNHQPGGLRTRWVRAFCGAGSLALGSVIVSGWYFYRNYTAIGVSFLTHAAAGGNRWWQYPGYRTPAQLVTFGRSLITPVYGDLTGYWDNLYSTLWSDGMLNGMVSYQAAPPWHYEPMATSLWLAFLLMLAVCMGTIPARAAETSQKMAVRFSVICIVIFLFALAFVWVTCPIYSTVKAS